MSMTGSNSVNFQNENGVVGTASPSQSTVTPFNAVKGGSNSSDLILYKSSNYKLGVKAPTNSSTYYRGKRFTDFLKRDCERNGIRRSVEIILASQDHEFPYVFLLFNNHNTLRGPKTLAPFDLLRGTLWPGESDEDGIRRILAELLMPPGVNYVPWEIKDLLYVSWRIHFDFNLYPYIPRHITDPKEVRKTYLVQLPPCADFCIPSNLTMVSVPIFELHGNDADFGTYFQSIAIVLSRFNYVFSPLINGQAPPVSNNTKIQGTAGPVNPEEDNNDTSNNANGLRIDLPSVTTSSILIKATNLLSTGDDDRMDQSS